MPAPKPETRPDATTQSITIAPSVDNQTQKVQFAFDPDSTEMLNGDSEVRLPPVSASNPAPLYSFGDHQEDEKHKNDFTSSDTINDTKDLIVTTNIAVLSREKIIGEEILVETITSDDDEEEIEAKKDSEVDLNRGDFDSDLKSPPETME